MTTPNDIMTAINKLLVTAFPIDKVYISLLPEDFKRPSFAIECVSAKRGDASRHMVRWSVQFVITCFLEEDEHGISDAEALLVRMAQVADMFRHGYISVAGRNLSIASVDGRADLFAAAITLHLDYFDERGSASQEYDPPMGGVEIKITQEG